MQAFDCFLVSRLWIGLIFRVHRSVDCFLQRMSAVSGFRLASHLFLTYASKYLVCISLDWWMHACLQKYRRLVHSQHVNNSKLTARANFICLSLSFLLLAVVCITTSAVQAMLPIFSIVYWAQNDSCKDRSSKNNNKNNAKAIALFWRLLQHRKQWQL